MKEIKGNLFFNRLKKKNTNFKFEACTVCKHVATGQFFFCSQPSLLVVS